MLKNTQINREVTKRIAHALGEMNERVVYVGGAIVSHYIDDPSAEDVRPTKDIDISMKIASLNELETIRQELIKKGFSQSHEDNVICRFRYDDILIDVMATKQIGWAPGNEWFEAGFDHFIIKKIDEISVKLLPLPYFLASKFAAFYDRGKTDPRTSNDFEDIVYILNHTSDIKDQILESDQRVRTYLKKVFFHILNDKILHEAVMANLFYEQQVARFNKIMINLKEICDGL
jgi:predicted nucleotidyltransferase